MNQLEAMSTCMEVVNQFLKTSFLGCFSSSDGFLQSLLLFFVLLWKSYVLGFNPLELVWFGGISGRRESGKGITGRILGPVVVWSARKVVVMD